MSFFHLHHIPHGDHLGGMPDKAVCQLGHMDQPILMDPDVNKGAKVNDIPHGPGENHPRLEVLDVQHIGAQHRLGQLRPDVPARLNQLPNQIPKGGDTDAHRLGGLGLSHGGNLSPKVLETPCGNVLQRVARLLQKGLCRIVGLRVNGGVVENLGTFRDPQKSCALLIGLGSQLRHLQQLPSGSEGTVFLPICHNVFGNGGTQTGNMLEQGGRCGIHIHAYGVDAVLHHAV